MSYVAKTIGKTAPFLLVFILFILSIYEARIDTPTYDEPANMAASYAYVYKNDFRLYPDNPPLVKILSGLFLFPIKDRIKFPDQLDIYNDPLKFDLYLFGTQFLYNSNNPTREIIFLTRLPNILFTVGIALILYLFAQKLYGQKAALLTLIFYTIDPNIRGHGHILAFDLPLAFFSLLIFYLTYFFYTSHKKSKRFFFLIPICFALGILTKFTFIFFILIYLLGLWTVKINNGIYPKKRLILLTTIMIFPFAALWILGLSSGYNSKSLDFDKLPIINSANTYLSNNPAWQIIKILPVPYFYNGVIKKFYAHNIVSQPSYLLGQVHAKNDWIYYFLVSFMLKTPLPTQFAIYFILFLLLRKTFSAQRVPQKCYFPFLIGAIFFLFMTIGSHINNTYRYLFPTLVFFMLGAGQIVNLLYWKRWVNSLLVVLLVGYLIFTSFFSFPYDLSYTNEITGIPPRGYKYLSDSEIDWGQDLERLADWLRRNNSNNETITLSYLGTADPSFYGIKYQPLRFEDLNNLKGIVAISVGNLTLGDWQITSSVDYQIGMTGAPLDSLRRKIPHATAGKSIFIYRL